MEFGPLVNFLIVSVSAIFVWISGTRLAIYADWIAHRYKIGRAFVGVLLLAFVTTLPEIATTITASTIGNAPLAISNLLGGINIQTVAIALADLVLVAGALTYFSPKPALLTAGVFVVLQLAITLMGSVYGEVFTIWNIGFWPILLFMNYLCMLYFTFHHEQDIKWIPRKAAIHSVMKVDVPPEKKFSNTKLISYFALNTTVVLFAGWAISYFADKLAVQWNWSGSWMGATLVALTTSLPEMSTTFGAVRQKAYVLAIANIFGSNVLTASLLLLADIFYREGAIMNQADPSTYILASVGIVITALFLWGILNRQKKTILRMGIDSFIVLVVYFASLYLLKVLAN